MNSTPRSSTAAADWFTSTYSADGNECVEIAALGTQVGVRDSKDLSRAPIFVQPAAFAAFVDAVRTGDLSSRA